MGLILMRALTCLYTMVYAATLVSLVHYHGASGFLVAAVLVTPIWLIGLWYLDAGDNL